MTNRQSIPSFFIVGAAKSGTTSLAKYLGQHPDIFMPESQKEPAYFADHTGHKNWDEYLAEFAGASGCRVVGEKSGAYLYDSQSAERIYRTNSAAKIIIALRNRVDTAYSLYLHNRREGYEVIPTFSEALAAEDERASSSDFRRNSLGYYANFLYRRRATYFPQIKRYFDVFPPDQIRIVRFADLKQNARSVCQDVFHFLGVDEEFEPDFTPANVGGRMRFQFIQNWYVHIPLLRRVVIGTTPQIVRRLVYRWNRLPSKAIPLVPEERRKYALQFANDVRLVRRHFAVDVA